MRTVDFVPYHLAKPVLVFIWAPDCCLKKKCEPIISARAETARNKTNHQK